MTDKYPGLYDGADTDAIVLNVIADEAISVGSPVIYVAAGTGELHPRVEPNDSQGANAAGVVVGGDNQGTYGGSDENAASAAGESVKLVTRGRCKVRVNGSDATIAVGDPLTLDNVDGMAEKAGASDNVFGRAMQGSTAYGDYILCHVTLEGVL